MLRYCPSSAPVALRLEQKSNIVSGIDVIRRTARSTLGSGGRRTLEKGTIAVMVGSSSSNIRCIATVNAFEPIALHEDDSRFLSSVEVREGCD